MTTPAELTFPTGIKPEFDESDGPEFDESDGPEFDGMGDSEEVDENWLNKLDKVIDVSTGAMIGLVFVVATANVLLEGVFEDGRRTIAKA